MAMQVSDPSNAIDSPSQGMVICCLAIGSKLFQAIVAKIIRCAGFSGDIWVGIRMPDGQQHTLTILDSRARPSVTRIKHDISRPPLPSPLSSPPFLDERQSRIVVGPSGNLLLYKPKEQQTLRSFLHQLS